MRHRSGCLAGGLVAILLGMCPGETRAARTIPQPVTRTLENGLKVAVFPSRRVAVVQIALVTPGGQTSEPAGLSGVGQITARLLTRGTTSRDARQFAQDVFRLGGTVSSTASRDYATVSGAFLARDLGSGLEILADAAINPIFSDDEIRGAQLDALRALQRAHHDPGALAEDGVWSLLFAGHAYGQPLMGTDSSVAGITRERIRAFHRDHYRPDASMLVIAGDVIPDSAFALASEWFGGWAGHAVPAPAAAIPAVPDRPRVRVIDVPEARYSVIRVGMRIPGRRSDDDVPVTLAAAGFAAGPTARLQRPEIQKRLGSSIAVSRGELRDGGAFQFGAPVNTDSVASMVDLLRDRIHDFAQHPPSGTELDDLRRSSLGAFFGSIETQGGLIGQWAGVAFIGQPANALTRMVARVEATTPETFAAAVPRWFDPDRVAIVAVGPAGPLQKQLARFGTVEVVHPQNTLAAPAPVDTVTTTPENTAQARAILDRALKAHGGLDSLRGIRDSSIEMKVAMGPARQETPGILRQVRKEPDRLASITQLRDFMSRQVLNGNRAWSVTGGAVLDADSAQTAGLKVSFMSDLPHLLLVLTDPGARLASRGTDRILDRTVDVLEARLASGQHRRYYFDSATHLLSAIDLFEGVPGIGTRRSRRLYGGYQNVNGIQWPFREERQIDGQSSIRIEVTGVRINTGVLDREFEKPGDVAH